MALSPVELRLRVPQLRVPTVLRCCPVTRPHLPGVRHGPNTAGRDLGAEMGLFLSPQAGDVGS